MNILDLIANDLTIEKINDNLYTTKEMDSLRIFVDTNSWYRFSKRVGGDCNAWIKYFHNGEDLEEYDFSNLENYLEKNKEESIRIFDSNQLYGNKIYADYLKNRNISYQTYLKYNLEYANNYIYIPLTDINNKRIGVQLRNTINKDKKHRYLFYLLNEKPLVYPLHEVKEIRNKVLLCEGTFSVLRWNQVINSDEYKIFNTLGASNLNNKLKELFNGIKNLYCIYDPDKAGRKFRDKLVDLFPNIICYCPTIKLDDLSDEQMIWFWKEYIK